MRHVRSDVERTAARVSLKLPSICGWNIISALNIGVGETKIVIGTKPLHHLIPEFVPRCTGNTRSGFFFERVNMNPGRA